MNKEFNDEALKKQQWYRHRRQWGSELAQDVHSVQERSELGMDWNKIWVWHCKTCHFEYQQTLENRAMGKGCPCCEAKIQAKSYRLATFEQSVGYRYPYLMKHWHPLQNQHLNAFELYPHTNKLVWWKCCRCGFEWRSSPHRQVLRLETSPFCSNCRRVEQLRVSSLGKTHPFLCEEWHKTRNVLTPDDVTYGSHYQANWICRVCQHEWESRVSSRTQKRTGCPACFKERQRRRMLDLNSKKERKLK